EVRGAVELAVVLGHDGNEGELAVGRKVTAGVVEEEDVAPGDLGRAVFPRRHLDYDAAERVADVSGDFGFGHGIAPEATLSLRRLTQRLLVAAGASPCSRATLARAMPRAGGGRGRVGRGGRRCGRRPAGPRAEPSAPGRAPAARTGPWPGRRPGRTSPS